MKSKIKKIFFILITLILCIFYFDTHYAIIDDKIYKNNVKYLNIRSLDESRVREVNKCTEIEMMILSYANKNKISKLRNFTNLRGLVIMSSNISSIDCEKINKLTNLDSFVIESYSIVDFKGFTNNTVSHIDIFVSTVKNLEYLSQCSSLISLVLNDSIVGDCIIEENQKYILKNSDVFSSLDNVITLGLYVDNIENVSGILEMNSLKEFKVNKGSISEEDVKLLEDKGISVVYCGENE